MPYVIVRMLHGKSKKYVHVYAPSLIVVGMRQIYLNLFMSFEEYFEFAVTVKHGP